MHRHGYKGRKFNRETDQRSALIKSLAESLVRDGSIKTTLSKAKELVPYIEKLVTKAKIADLHNRRQVIDGLQTVESGHKLVDELAPKMSARNSGYVRITKLENRRGDNSPMAEISFVDDLKEAPVAKDQSKTTPKATPKPKTIVKKTTTKEKK